VTIEASVKRFVQFVLIVSTVLGSWLGMQAVHELGHVLGAWLTGGEVARVVLNPLTLSRTDLARDPHPLAVVWCGPAIGVMLPLMAWGIAAWLRLAGAFVLRFFAGFCLIANGAYIAGGSFAGVGDCGQMLRHGAAVWQLWLFGALSVPLGLRVWHRLGADFGFGSEGKPIRPAVAYGSLIACGLLIVLGLWVDGR
jgi:hypothetical protein